MSRPAPRETLRALSLRFFPDRSVFELYANDESVISGAFFFHHAENLKAAAMHRKGPKIPLTVDGWEMQPLKWSAYQSVDKANQ